MGDFQKNQYLIILYFILSYFPPKFSHKKRMIITILKYHFLQLFFNFLSFFSLFASFQNLCKALYLLSKLQIVRINDNLAIYICFIFHFYHLLFIISSLDFKFVSLFDNKIFFNSS